MAVFFSGLGRMSYRAEWLAAVLACGPDALLSHHAAAALWDLRPIPQGKIDVTAPVKRTHKGVRCHVARTMPDGTIIDGAPVTSLERTYLDYAEQATERQLIAALEAGQRQNVLDLRKLRRCMDASPGRQGLKPLAAAIAQLTDHPQWTQSELENEFLHLLRAHHLPEPRLNVLVLGELVDCAWPEQKVIVELDGYAFHSARRTFEADRKRDIKLQKAGWSVLRFTHRRVRSEPATVIADVRHMLAR
jgi:very-short-patch-repair endonuclease